MKLKIIFLSIIFLNPLTSHAQRKVFDIIQYGAVANGKTTNTAAIQKAIDECSAKGGGTVLIPGNLTEPAIYTTGTLVLKNNVELKIDTGAILTGSTNYADYQEIEPFVDGVGQTRGACLIGAVAAANIAVTGKGIINGQGELWKTTNNPDYGRRPFLLRIVRSTHCRLKDIHLQNSAAWMCNFDLCSQMDIAGIRIVNNVNNNNDGIDIDACRNVRISNCVINSSDDAICFKSTRGDVPCRNVVVTGNDLASRCAGIKWGTESMGDFLHFTIRGNYIHDTNLGGIKILTADGANISDFKITGNRMKNVNVPVFICIKSRLKTYHDQPGKAVGSIGKILISKLIATDCRTIGIFVTGIPGRYAGPSIEFKDVQLSGLGDKAPAEDAKRVPPEDVTSYPEVNRFGVLPAYGAFIRHTKGVTFKQVTLLKKQDDKRYAVLFDDTDIRLKDVQITAVKDIDGLNSFAGFHSFN